MLPHCGHLLRCGARQRLAALRVRSRILDVLRFGTPMCALPKQPFLEKQVGPTELLKITILKRGNRWNSCNPFKVLILIYPARSNPPYASCFAPLFRLVFPRKRDRRSGRNADAAGD